MAFDRSNPALHAETITLDNYGNSYRGLWVGADGNVALRLHGAASDVVIPGVKAGSVVPIECVGVSTTGTTVSSPTTNILGLW